jgi:Na+-driven multidrug efflux pump
MAIIMAVTSLFFPSVYNTTETARSIATYMMLISAVTMPFSAFAHAAYFTLRSGGKVAVTLLFDSVYMWSAVLPVSFIAAYCTNMSIHWLYLLCQCTEIVKVVFGAILIKQGKWVRQLVADESLKQ